MRAASVTPFLLVLSAVSAPLSAQRREVAVIAGGNFSSASGGRIDHAEAHMGFQGGLSLRIPRTPKLSVQVEFLLIQRRFFAARAPSTLPSSQVGPRSDAPNILFAQVPLLLRFQRGYSTERPIRPYFVVGPFLALRLHCQRTLIEASGGVSHPDCSVTPVDRPVSTDPFFPALFADLDVGLLGEVGVQITRFSVGLRGEKSLRNLVDQGVLPTSPLDRSRLWSASISVGYLLRVL
jgi:hypothetical protein